MVLLLLLIVIKIIQQFVTAMPDLLALDVTRLIMLVLSLIDLSLVGNLVVVVLSGYENSSRDSTSTRRTGRSGWERSILRGSN
jgi:uncharacterized membrane protein YqhA